MNKILVDQSVIEQALETFEPHGEKYPHIITALREALTEQAEQEQVCIDWDTKTDEPIMGYAAPVRTKDLTDDEIREIEMSVEPFAIDLARAVIAADREKNK